ncbi:VOC family protein [Paractinoplanes ferrugineus]|uniref:Glyoxalase n=1 Tax=Paractinoplanes ferrugineus TaxID=113564 RepID=A0A919J125_9ACTN|nr:VOC family protein [Actinoplanes ferrugineus]GIE12505.1 glyoxalase [Actinoplanes ferrugineus]
MSRPVVHFEVIGADPAALRDYYAALFGWSFDVGNAAEAVSEPGNYGFVQPGAGIPGGIGGGPGFAARTLFYVGVPDVDEALREAERLGGTRLSGPHQHPDTPLTVGFFTDPEGHLVGVAASH